jgi:hypothetical protein
VPITWITSLNSLAVAAEAEAAGAAVALELLPAWFCTKQSLRDAIAVARAAVPTLDTAVIEGAVPRHHDVLAAAGIRVVAVDTLAGVQRGSRRPAPQGWACRNVAWGLWEVLIGPGSRRPRGWLSWTGFTGQPRAGSLSPVAQDRPAQIAHERRGHEEADVCGDTHALEREARHEVRGEQHRHQPGHDDSREAEDS